MKACAALIVIALVVGAPAAVAGEVAPLVRVNIIDGTDGRGSLLDLGPEFGLTPAEIDRIRTVSGHVGCFEPLPQVGSGALFLTNGQVLSAGHLFFTPDGAKASKCYFRQQTPRSAWRELMTDDANARFGAIPPKPGSNHDWAVVRLAEPIDGAEPFLVDDTTPAAGDELVVIAAHPADLDDIDPNVPVVQRCTVRRAPISSSTTSFYRTDCDTTGASSGGMHLFRAGGRLVFRGITISTGPWREPEFAGAAYDEKGGSVTTALGTDAAILEAGQDLAIEARFWSAAPAE